MWIKWIVLAVWHALKQGSTGKSEGTPKPRSLWPMAVAILVLGLTVLAGLWMAGRYAEYWAGRNAREAEREAVYQELEADYQRQLQERDAQLSRYETTAETLRAEVEWARVHVANREREIATLKESASDEILQCLRVVIDPLLVP